MRCSALFKVVRNPTSLKLNLIKLLYILFLTAEKIEDIVFAHSTWDSYSEMLRFFKQFFLNYNLNNY